MNLVQILLSTVVGTACMTLFSYGASLILQKQFREPELLNESIVRAGAMSYTTSKNHPAGWIIHFGIGLAFVTLYYGIATLLDFELTFISAGCGCAKRDSRDHQLVCDVQGSSKTASDRFKRILHSA